MEEVNNRLDPIHGMVWQIVIQAMDSTHNFMLTASKRKLS
jgi:hypothetical protein